MASDALQALRRLWAIGSGLLARQQLRLLAFLASGLLLWQVLDFLPMFFFNSKAFQAKLEQYIDASRLAISYQGIDVSLFRGVRVIGVRVSFDRDFSRGRYLLEAPAVYIRKPLSFIGAEESALPERARVIIEDGRLGYWVTSDRADRELIEQVRNLLQKDRRYHVECDRCRFSLNVKDNSYFQEVTPVENLSFTLHHGGKEVQTLVRYESSAIGNGDFFGRFDACSSMQCDDLEGYWYFKPSHLRLAILNNFQKDIDITSGTASGEIAFDRKLTDTVKKVRGKEVTVREPLSNFRMAMSSRSFAVRRKKLPWYEVDAFSVDTRMQIKGSSSTGYVRGALDDYRIQAEFEDLRPEALPEKYLFRIEPEIFGEKRLNLPAHRVLKGLRGFEINLSGRKGNKYTRNEISLDIADGAFIAGENMPPLLLPSVQLSLSNEKLSGQVRALAGSSLFSADLSGAVELYPVQFVPLPDALLREVADAEERTIFSLRGKVSCPLTIDTLNWADIRPFVDAWLKDYWEEVQEGIQYSWLPSRLRRREYFVRFIQYLDFSMPIDIKRFTWGAEMPLKGSFFFSPLYGGGGFKLESPDGKNSTSLMVSYGSNEPNAPYMSHNLNLNLDYAYELLSPWFGEDYFEYFSSAQIVHFNNFMGERPADHYLKSVSVTDMRLTRVRLGKWARAQALPLQWEIVDVKTNRSNGYGAISLIRAENDNNILAGYGEYKLFDRQIDTSLKYSVQMR
jgi:hypothetical protein